MLPKNPAVFAKMSAVSEWRVADATITALLGTRGPDGEDLLRLLPKFVAVGLALDESEFLEIKLDPTQFDVVPLLRLSTRQDRPPIWKYLSENDVVELEEGDNIKLGRV